MSRTLAWGIAVLVVCVAVGAIVQALGRGDSAARIAAIFFSGVAVGIGVASVVFSRVSTPEKRVV